MLDVETMSADLKLEALLALLIGKRVITLGEYERTKKQYVELLNEEFEERLKESFKSK